MGAGGMQKERNFFLLNVSRISEKNYKTFIFAPTSKKRARQGKIGSE
jgi:hypothetical protein